MTTYYFVAASKRFLTEEEPFEEVLRERHRNYNETEKEIDFWFVVEPAFLESPELASTKATCPQPAAAVITTDQTLVHWLKLRLEFVATGEFQAPSESIPEPLASLAAAS